MRRAAEATEEPHLPGVPGSWRLDLRRGYGSTSIAGKRDQLAGKLQARYGYEKAQIEREIDAFTRALNK